jgi:DNA-binding transcriptional LysR family regulator
MKRDVSIRTEDLEAFVASARTGTLVGAARAVGVSKSVLTRRIARLESTLGAGVFLRSTRGLKLTALGRRVLRHAQRLSRDMEAIAQIADTATHELRGTLRVTAPAAFATVRLHRVFARFIERFPGVQLDLRFDDRYVDLAAREVDLALRIGAMRDTAHYTVRRIGMIGHSVVASDRYLNQAPPLSSPRDLAQHRCLVHSGVSMAHQWRFLVNGRWTTPQPGSIVHADVVGALVELAAEGVGLAVLPTCLIRNEILSGRLREVLCDQALPRRGAFCVAPYRRPWPPTVHALTEQILAACKSSCAGDASGNPQGSRAGAPENRCMPGGRQEEGS